MTDCIFSKERELAGMPVVAEDEYGAMNELVGRFAKMINSFQSLKHGMYSNVDVPDSDDLHVDPRIRDFMKGFRSKVCLFMLCASHCITRCIICMETILGLNT